MRLLILMTNASALTLSDATKYPSGFWAEEFAVPYRLFTERGYSIDIATVGGIQPSVDRASLDPPTLQYVRPAGSRIDDAAKASEWADIIAAAPELQHPLAVEGLSCEQMQSYDGVYLCGGHGCMEDQPTSEALGRLIVWTYELAFPVAAVCHGHTAMLSARDADGRFPYAGYQMTAFSHDEERVTPIYGRLPLIVEDELRQRGVKYSQAPLLWDAHVVTDRNLVTGQNPFSSNLLAETFLHELALARAQAVTLAGQG